MALFLVYVRTIANLFSLGIDNERLLAGVLGSHLLSIEWRLPYPLRGEGVNVRRRRVLNKVSMRLIQWKSRAVQTIYIAHMGE